MDSHLEDVYESSQGADVDDLDGFEWCFDDETDDDEDEGTPIEIDDEPMPEWPTAADKREYEIYKPVPLTDEELAQLQGDWDRYGYMVDLLNDLSDR